MELNTRLLLQTWLRIKEGIFCKLLVGPLDLQQKLSSR